MISRDQLHQMLLAKQRDSGSTSNVALNAAMAEVDTLCCAGDEAGARGVVESFVPSMEERGEQLRPSTDAPESRTARDRLAGRSGAHR